MLRVESKNKYKIPVVSVTRDVVSKFGGVCVELPRGYFQGTQLYGEYSESKMRVIDRVLVQQGISFLRNYPALCYGLDDSEGLDIVLKDGHHRIRRAGKFDIKFIPTMVLPLEAVQDLIFKQLGERFSLEELREGLQMEIALAKHSFTDCMEARSKKGLLGGTLGSLYSVYDLRERFTNF